MTNQDYWDVLKGIFWAIVACIIISVCCSCSHTKYVTVPEYHVEFISKTDSFMQHDSIYLHDSVFCSVKGDSVFLTKWQTKYIERIKYISKTDTICKQDSIVMPVIQEVEKVKVDYKGWLVALLLALGFGLFIKVKKL